MLGLSESHQSGHWNTHQGYYCCCAGHDMDIAFVVGTCVTVVKCSRVLMLMAQKEQDWSRGTATLIVHTFVTVLKKLVLFIHYCRWHIHEQFWILWIQLFWLSELSWRHWSSLYTCSWQRTMEEFWTLVSWGYCYSLYKLSWLRWSMVNTCYSWQERSNLECGGYGSSVCALLWLCWRSVLVHTQAVDGIGKSRFGFKQDFVQLNHDRGINEKQQKQFWMLGIRLLIVCFFYENVEAGACV